MPCGSCAKRRQRLLAKNKKASAASKTLRRTKRRGIKAKAIARPMPMPKRCPICRSATKRVSKAGKNLLRCMNPKCTFVRKL